MLAKLSTRRYRVGLEPVGADVKRAAAGTSKSAVSRRFVARTERALAELLAQNLSGLDLIALMVDGIRVADRCCVVALGSPATAPRPRWPWPRAPAWSPTC